MVEWLKVRLTARATISHKSQLQWYSRRAERADWADLAEDLWFHAYPDLDDKTLAAGQPADRLKTCCFCNPGAGVPQGHIFTGAEQEEEAQEEEAQVGPSMSDQGYSCRKTD